MASLSPACTAGWKRSGCSPEPLPRRAIDRHDAPTVPHAGAVDMVDARDRAVFHREGETRLRVEAERQTERGADRASMRHRYDVAAAIVVEHGMNRPRDPLHDIDKTFTTGSALMCRRVPEA